MLRVSAIWLSLIPIFLPLAGVEAQSSLCFSDEQLKSVLIDVHFFGVGQMAGTCVGRFPELLPQATELTKKLESTYDAQLSKVDRISIEAFEQHYPGHGREMRDKNDNVASEPSCLAAKQYTREQCDNVMSALEGFTVANDWAAVTYFPLSFFDRERARVPKC